MSDKIEYRFASSDHSEIKCDTDWTECIEFSYYIVLNTVLCDIWYNLYPDRFLICNSDAMVDGTDNTLKIWLFHNWCRQIRSCNHNYRGSSVFFSGYWWGFVWSVRVEICMDRSSAFVCSFQYYLLFLEFCQTWLVVFLNASLECSCSIKFDEFYKTFSIASVSTLQVSLTGTTHERAELVISTVTENAQKELFFRCFILFPKISVWCSNSLFDLLFDTFFDDALSVVSAIKRDGASVI